MARGGMIKFYLRLGDDLFYAIRNAFSDSQLTVGKQKFKACAVRIIKHEARLKGFDLVMHKNEDGEIAVSHVMFKSEADYLLFKLKYSGMKND